MELAIEIAEYIKKIKFKDIPKTSIFVAKQLILDSLGVAIAGSTAQGVKEIVDLMKEWGGIPQSTVFCYGIKLPAINAAFANSIMIHARDFDDTHDGAVVHTSVTILPTVLAIAEKRGGVSGEDFLTAFVLGIDLNARLGLAISHALKFYDNIIPWIRTSVCGIFGATASACKIEQMTETEIINALGISLSQVAGTRQVVSDSALTKRIQPAFMTRSAILSTFLAKKGITGCKEVFEGKYGYFNLYWNGSYNRELLIDGLGRRFEIEEVSLKPYPCCRYTHGAIDATLACINKYNISPDSIREINIYLVKHPFFDLVSRPFSIRGNPSVDAQFSIPYVVASAILDKFVFLETFEPKMVKKRSTHPLLRKIKVLVDREVRNPDSLGPVTVEIKIKAGKKYSETIEDFKGHPRNRMTNEECQAKFINCANYSVKPFSKKNLNKIIQMVYQLETLKTIDEFISLLKPV